MFPFIHHGRIPRRRCRALRTYLWLQSHIISGFSSLQRGCCFYCFTKSLLFSSVVISSNFFCFGNHEDDGNPVFPCYACMLECSAAWRPSWAPHSGYETAACGQSSGRMRHLWETRAGSSPLSQGGKQPRSPGSPGCLCPCGRACCLCGKPCRGSETITYTLKQRWIQQNIIDP